MSRSQRNATISGMLLVIVAMFWMVVRHMLWQPGQLSAARDRELTQRIASLEAENRGLRLKVQTLSEALAAPSAVPANGNSSSPVAMPSMAPRRAPSATSRPPGAEASASDPDDAPPQSTRRVGLVQKFLTLTPTESAKLEEYFRDHEGNGMPEILAEGIEKALGKEQADSYRDRVRDSFRKAEDEENEKEVLFLSRKLALTGEQEDALRAATREAAALGADSNVPHGGSGPSSVQQYLEALKARRSLIDQRMQAILSAEQLQAYLEYQATSAEKDLELLHGPATPVQK